MYAKSDSDLSYIQFIYNQVINTKYIAIGAEVCLQNNKLIVRHRAHQSTYRRTYKCPHQKNIAVG